MLGRVLAGLSKLGEIRCSFVWPAPDCARIEETTCWCELVVDVGNEVSASSLGGEILL